MWYLSFDCAFGSLAFCLLKYDPDGFVANVALWARINAIRAGKHDPHEIDAVCHELGQYLFLLDCDVVNVLEAHVSECTVDKLEALITYVHNRIYKYVPALREMQGRVLVEYQMGQNMAARTVSVALCTLFISEGIDVRLVAPSLKNKIFFCEEGRWCYFAERYSNPYSANKEHARFNFQYILKNGLPGNPALKGVLGDKKTIGHIADAFMQVLGYKQAGEPKAF